MACVVLRKITRAVTLSRLSLSADSDVPGDWSNVPPHRVQLTNWRAEFMVLWHDYFIYLTIYCSSDSTQMKKYIFRDDCDLFRVCNKITFRFRNISLLMNTLVTIVPSLGSGECVRLLLFLSSCLFVRINDVSFVIISDQHCCYFLENLYK